MPSAVVTRKQSVLFRAHLRGEHLKALASSAKAISDVVVLDLNSDHDEHCIRFWADDGDSKGTRPTCAMVGQVNNSAFQAVEGDGTVRTIQVPTKHLLEVIASFGDLKRPIEMRLTTQDNRFLLSLQQAKDEASDPDVRTISVQPSDSKPITPVIPKGAYAAVNLTTIKKVVNGLKRNTDVVTLTVDEKGVEIAASTKRMQDSWKHAATTNGKAKGLFSPSFLKKAVTSAREIDDAGEIHLTDDHPLKVTAANEDLDVRVYIASKGVMK